MGAKSKWQPLAAADPNPVSDHDPFSLGDSDEEEPKRKDGKPEEGETGDDALKEDEQPTEAKPPPAAPSTGAADSPETGAKPI